VTLHTSPEPTPPALRDYLALVRRRLWLIVFLTIITAGTALGVAATQETLWQGRAQVLLSQSNLANALNNVQDPAVSEQSDRVAQTQARLARVSAVAEGAIRRADANMTVEEFLDASAVRVDANTDLLEFRFTSNSTDEARRLATAYASSYVDYRVDLDTAALRRARDEVTRRLELLESLGQDQGELYATLVDKDQQLSSLQVLQTQNSMLVQPADDLTKVQPRLVRAGMLGGVIGLVFAFAVAFARDALDTRLRRSEEVEETLGLPLAGRVPRAPRRIRRDDIPVMLAAPDTPEAEAVRILRMNVEFLMQEREASFPLMVTSALPDEGKSTTAANLAIAFATSGRTVTLVDLDFRRPSLARLFAVSESPGIVDVVMGAAPLDDALVEVPLADTPRPGLPTFLAGADGGHGHGPGRLSIVPAGTPASSPGELLQSRALGRVLDALSADGIVIVDTPPLLSVVDGLAVSRRVGSVLVVVRMPVYRRQTIIDLRRSLKGMSPKLLGVATTGTSTEAGYGYGYGYAYKSAAGERGDRAKRSSAPT
jgi:succinoglycan biosynthesis transport protein ExoP